MTTVKFIVLVNAYHNVASHRLIGSGVHDTLEAALMDAHRSSLIAKHGGRIEKITTTRETAHTFHKEA